MNREYHQWHSPHLQRDMEMLVFGEAGRKILAFPTRDGRFYEYENLGIIHALSNKLSSGQIQLFCVDNLAHESFYASQIPPANRIRRHNQFEQYLLNEVLPFMNSKNSHPDTSALGCSLGAFQATNLAFRHPHLFKTLYAFSGRYDLTLAVEYFYNVFDGYYDEDIYFHTPSHFLANLNCETRLEQFRQMELIFTIGKEDPFLNNNHQLSQILWSKGIQHTLHEWDGRAHRGRSWRQMVQTYL